MFYDYRCKKCNYIFTQQHGMNESPLIKCPQCSAKADKLITGGAGVIFKGSGFFVTDYKNK